MNILKLALDKSARRIDADGRLHIDMSHISKANICPYYGSEIPGYAELGLDAGKVYRLLRDPVELERAAHTFERLPILSEHVPITVDLMAEDENLKKLVIGSIGSDVSFNSPYLNADLCIWDKDSIAGIDTEQIKELSCAYRYVPVMEPGQFDGQAYDGRMTQLQGNHLALVEVGRAGSDVVVADKNPFTFKESAMKMTKFGKAIFAALCAASPVLAADSAVPALLMSATRKNINLPEVKAKLLALDANLDPEKLNNMLDTMVDAQDDPKPTMIPPANEPNASPLDSAKALLTGKVDDDTLSKVLALFTPPAALDEEDDKMTKEEVKGAMDSLRKELLAAEQARREVEPLVGLVIGLDSAAAVYAFALDHMKVEHKDITDVNALRAIYKVASANRLPDAITPIVASDSADVLAMFPALSRFKRG